MGGLPIYLDQLVSYLELDQVMSVSDSDASKKILKSCGVDENLNWRV